MEVNGNVDRNELIERTRRFANRCGKLALALPDSPLGNHIRGQLLRSGTSVGANYRAACVAHAKPGFVSKLSIVIEETDENCFWMEFIIDENLMGEDKVNPLLKEAKELTSIFIASRKTARKNSK